VHSSHQPLRPSLATTILHVNSPYANRCFFTKRRLGTRQLNTHDALRPAVQPLGLPQLPAKSAKCTNKARIEYIYGSGYTHCFKFRFLFLNHTVKITYLKQTCHFENLVQFLSIYFKILDFSVVSV
jgi:hypothetical protein